MRQTSITLDPMMMLGRPPRRSPESARAALACARRLVDDARRALTELEAAYEALRAELRADSDRAVRALAHEDGR